MYLRNRKQFLCFCRVIETLWERARNEKLRGSKVVDGSSCQTIVHAPSEIKNEKHMLYIARENRLPHSWRVGTILNYARIVKGF